MYLVAAGMLASAARTRDKPDDMTLTTYFAALGNAVNALRTRPIPDDMTLTRNLVAVGMLASPARTRDRPDMATLTMYLVAAGMLVIADLTRERPDETNRTSNAVAVGMLVIALRTRPMPVVMIGMTMGLTTPYKPAMPALMILNGAAKAPASNPAAACAPEYKTFHADASPLIPALMTPNGTVNRVASVRATRLAGVQINENNPAPIPLNVARMESPTARHVLTRPVIRFFAVLIGWSNALPSTGQ